jgi:hypothetical protein
VDEQITYEINDAEIQEYDLTPTDQFEIIQHIELLDMPIHVTEHRLRTYVNSDGETFLPHVPELRNQPIFGPRMLAMIGWLKSRAHLRQARAKLFSIPSSIDRCQSRRR